MKVLMLILIAFLSISINAQSIDSSAVEANIGNILFSETNINYSIFAVDINDAKVKNEIEILDKNNLLRDCYVFIAKDTSTDGKIILGIFKNNSIIWKTQPVIDGTLVNDYNVWKILDLKNNGDVNILININPYCGKIYCRSLWIIKWDGNSGELNNQYDDQGKSTIFTEAGEFQLVDIDGNGIWEILGQKILSSEYDENTEEEIVKTKPILFTWEGNIIDSHGTILPNFLPQNKLNVNVKAKVEKQDENYNYVYILDNQVNSVQSIENFSINTSVDSVYESKAPSKWWFLNRNDSSLLYFGWNPDSEGYNFIQPGEQGSNFTIVVRYPPSILKYFIQGNNGELNYYISRIAYNSIHGYTIGPSIIQSFNSIDETDSLLNYNQHSLQLGWIKNQSTADKYTNYFTTAKSQLQQNNITGVKSTLNQVLQNVDVDSTSNLTSEAYALLKYNTEYLLNNLPEETTANLTVKLANSTGNLLTGGLLQYYEGSWKDAVNNGDGTFAVNTDKQSLSLRMTYEYGTQTVSNVPSQNNTFTFQTVNTVVQLKNSQGNLINEEGIVKYYAGAWRDLGTTVNGVATKELLPNNYSFRMTYAYGSNDKQQDIGTNSTVVFQTVNANVQLENSAGTLIDEGIVKYYAGAWRDFGTTVNGTTAKELLPNNYSFRMTYAYGSNDKQQDIGTNSTVVFQTVNANVQLKNSQGNLIDEGTVKYYAGAWRDFGTTTNGVAAKELLPNNYNFRMNYEYVSNDKQQNLGTNSTVSFSTVLATVKVNDAQNQPVDNADVKYYAGAWRNLGTTVNGEATKELLPSNITFRASANGVSKDMQQDISTNSTVEIILNTGQ